MLILLCAVVHKHLYYYAYKIGIRALNVYYVRLQSTSRPGSIIIHNNIISIGGKQTKLALLFELITDRCTYSHYNIIMAKCVEIPIHTQRTIICQANECNNNNNKPETRVLFINNIYHMCRYIGTLFSGYMPVGTCRYIRCVR